MSDNLPGKGLFGWLGRQVGYVSKAVKAKAAAQPPAKRSAPQSPPRPPTAEQPAPPADPPVVYRHDQVQEAEHPTDPGLKLRRTIIDEVIVDKKGPRSE
jgi:hypothetical protein